MEKSVAKCLRLMEVLSRSEEPRGVTELALEIDLTKNNIHRLLETLVAFGYVQQDERTRRYELTLKLWELGAAVLARRDIREAARPFMQELAEATQESIHLSLLEGDHVVYIDKIESDHPIRAYSRIGSRLPLYSVASGKAMLAWQAEDAIQQACRQVAVHAKQSRVTVKAFRAELEVIRERGYSLTRGEWRAGVGGVSAPIRNSSGAVFAAIAVSCPVERLTGAAIREFAPQVVRAAEAISRQLGHRPPGQDAPAPKHARRRR